MKKTITLFVAVFAFSIGVLAYYVLKPIKQSSANTAEFQNFRNTLEFNVSNLEVGETASFRAILVKTPGTNCIELFSPADYKKYHGDSLWAATAKLAIEPRLLFLSWWNKEVIVTGKMTRILNSKETSETCGIVTGNIFEISSISDNLPFTKE
ncbi:MAG TPA: hypothetical protein PKY82_25785 [Pyrinomonadaceae bacterium]|nr:hypothetical protein [Pyrinomonadaceae bacterium]